MGTVATAFNNTFAAGSNIAKASARALGSTIESFFAAPYRLTNNATNPTAAAGYVLQLVGADTTASFLEVDTFGAVASTRYRRAEGTAGAPTATVSSTILGAVEFCGYYTAGGTAYTDGKAQVRGVAAENWTSSANGSQIEFWTTPSTTSTIAKAATIGNDKTFKALGGIGYATGVGGTATQTTSKSTGVTLNALSGQITTHNANLNGTTTVSFTWTNSYIEATDKLSLNHASGGTFGTYILGYSCGAGTATISIRNVTGGVLGDALVIDFIVFKGVHS